MNKPIKKNRVFWLIQTLVWAGLAVFNLTVRGYFVHYHIGELVNSFSLFVGLMVSTGCLRYFYQKTPNATLSAILWRIVLGSILAGVTKASAVALLAITTVNTANANIYIGAKASTFTDESLKIATINITSESKLGYGLFAGLKMDNNFGLEVDYTQKKPE